MANTPAWFNEVYYLNSKLIQLRASGETGYNNIVDVLVAIEAAGLTPYEHFEMYSLVELTSPNKFFNAGEYLEAKARQLNEKDGVTSWTPGAVAIAIREAGLNLYEHFHQYGWAEGVNPSNDFDVNLYLQAKLADLQENDPEGEWTPEKLEAVLQADGLDPVEHYIEFGEAEGIAVSPATDPVTPVDREGLTFVLTTGIDNFIGTPGDDTFIGGNGANNTFGPADQLDGAGGYDTLKLYSGATAAAGGNLIPTIKNIESIYLNGTTGGLNASTIAGVEAVEADSISVAQTFTLGASQSLKLSNINGATFATTVAGTAAGGITLNNVVDTSVTPSVAQTLNVDTRDASVKITATGGASNINLGNTVSGTSLAALAIEGDAALRVNAGAVFANLTSVDASKHTAGVNFIQGVDTNLTFTGGEGNDRLQVANAAIVAQDHLDGGAGRDTLAITTGSLTAPQVANVKNFEVLELRGTTGGTITQDASVFDANNTWEGLTIVNTSTVAGGTQSFVVNNLAATAKDNIVVNHATVATPVNLTATVQGFLPGGTTDTASITVNANVTGGVATTNLTFADVDVLNIVSARAATAAVANSNTISLVTPDLEKIVLTGNATTVLSPGVGSGGITEVDASGLVMANGTTAGLTFAQLVGATQSLLVTGSNGQDSITVDNARGTVVANGGNDTIIFSTVAGAQADQNVILSAKDYVAGGALTVTFTTPNLTAAGFERIDFSSDVEALLVANGQNLAATTANQTIGNALNSANNVAFAGGVLQFDLNGDGQFNAADDFSITLAGVTTVTYDATLDAFTVV